MIDAVRRFVCVLGLVLGVAGCGPTSSENPSSERCGDGVVQQQETCDDGLNAKGDGCDEACQVEQGWQCTGAPSRCTRQTGSCADGSAKCDANALCTEASGSFACTCKPGYTGDGFTCTDIDECASGTTTCDANAHCTNTPGGFTCACKSGYTGDGTTCTDADECASNTDNCDANATCTNTTGGFTCACKGGFSGNGVTCTDINECASNTDNCDVNATCVNTAGSFTCACKVGYSGDGVTCTDIDECADPKTCAPGETCTNTPGHYTCTPTTCEAPRTTCGSECVDLTSDANHCGDCDNACGGGQSCVESLCLGSGNLQISATWNRPGDADLIVSTPSGKLVWWDNLGPNAGTDFGQMDRDDTSGQGPENVFWASDRTPPSGTYHVCFETADFNPSPSPDSPITCSVSVRRPGKAPQTVTKSFTGSAYTFPKACNTNTASYVTSITYP
ncbi:Fibrillin-1 (MP340) [Cystobacter fuscus]|uniref:Fibrillin-1 (MP340) n=1 Tax=Cystobacter fuscus TaxID=43 RepID=A0A250J0D8_9BACT|nr:EGF domain-containing protein [Cystobacter fuscus]ATB36871.1 Fibrillin-1 (MP340) [Cystobacter fuscus]